MKTFKEKCEEAQYRDDEMKRMILKCDITKIEAKLVAENFGFSMLFQIERDEEIQIVAIELNRNAIYYIRNPTEKVKQIHNMIWEI